MVHCIIGAGTEESAMSKKKNRLHGHYCKICGEYKANEKFSGKGHAAHICKACSRLSAAEKAAVMDINRLMSFPMRRLSEGEGQSVTLKDGKMTKIFRYIVYALESFMWEQDCSLRPDEGDYAPFF